MTDITEVAEGIYLIETEQSRMIGGSGLPISSLAYYVDGPSPFIVETGPSVVTPELLDAIRKVGDPSRLSCAILTHVHLDHGGGAGSLARQLPQVQIVVHQRGAKHLVDPSRLAEASRQAFGLQYEEQYGPILPVPERQVRAVDDGDIIDLGKRKLKVVYAPGHASHHMCVYDEESRELFCGEALGRPQSSIVPVVAGFDPDAAIETTERLGQLGATTAFCSHGGVSRKAGRLIESVRDNMTAYRDIILGAAKAGEAKERIVEKLRTYHKEHPSELVTAALQFDNLIARHIAYFKQKGSI